MLSNQPTPCSVGMRSRVNGWRSPYMSTGAWPRASASSRSKARERLPISSNAGSNSSLSGRRVQSGVQWCVRPSAQYWAR